MIDRALVVGLGSIGRRHLRLLREVLPEADIRVLRHTGCNGPIKGADGCFEKLETACEFRPDLAVIASPAPFHLPVASALARAGAHLMVEKPVSDSAAGVAELLALCAAEGRQLQVGYNLRFLDTLQRFRAELTAGTIGTVRLVRCEIGQYLPDWRPDVDYRGAVSARRDLGGGVLLELSHEVDMLRWVFGEVAWLSCWIGRLGLLEIDVEDSAALNFGFVEGPVAQLSMDFLRRDAKRVCTAIGDDGTLVWDAMAGRVARFDPGTGAWADLFVVPPERDTTYLAQLHALLAAISTSRSDAIAAQGADGLAVLRLVEAAMASDADAGRRIAIGDRA